MKRYLNFKEFEQQIYLISFITKHNIKQKDIQLIHIYNGYKCLLGYWSSKLFGL